MSPSREIASDTDSQVADSADARAAVLRGKVQCFFQQHHAALIKFFAARLHCIQDAKDVAQETYEWLLQHRDDPRLVTWLGPINPLVYRVAWNIAGNRLLKHRRHARLGRRFLVTTADSPAPEQVCSAREDLMIIEESLKELPWRCRMVFMLARIEGLNFEEIAARMHISLRSVYRHVERALDHCLQRLDEAATVTEKNAEPGKGRSAEARRVSAGSRPALRKGETRRVEPKMNAPDLPP